MDDEKRNEGPSLPADGAGNGEGNGSDGDGSGDDLTTQRTSPGGPPANSTGGDARAQQAQETTIKSRRGTPGEANSALEETKSYLEGKISTADLLRARGSREALLPGALEDRDKGLAGRPPFHGSLAPPIGGVNSEADLYDIEEKHTVHAEPGIHVFAPHMLNIPSVEKKERKERKKRKERNEK